MERLIEESLKLQDSEKQFKDKMCRLVSDEYVDDAINGRPGRSVYLTWKIENDSKYDWPRYPILKNVTASQKVLKYIPTEKYSPEQLIKTKLKANTEWEFSYQLDLPEDIPNGVFVLKFQMVDPLVMNQMINDEEEFDQKEILRKSKFGEGLSVTLQVSGATRAVLGTSQNDIGGVSGLMASIDQEIEVDQQFQDNNMYG